MFPFTYHHHHHHLVGSLKLKIFNIFSQLQLFKKNSKNVLNRVKNAVFFFGSSLKLRTNKTNCSSSNDKKKTYF